MIKGLDKYLTQGPPDDGFDSWCEQVIEGISRINPDWDKDGVFLDSDEGNALLNKYFNEERDYSYAAMAIYTSNPDK